MSGKKNLLSPEEAAIRVGISRSLVYRLCQERRLVHYRVGGKGRRGKILIDPDDLDAYLAACRVTELPDEDGPLTHIH
jgi:excisionase family DNA binding protein